MNMIRARRRNRLGFTLIELLAVIAIMGLLMGIVAVSVVSFVSQAKVKTAKVQIKNFMQALDLYRQMNSRYPATHEGLEALLRDKLLTEEYVPKDPWGNDYVYYFPGMERFDMYDIVCYGEDGQPGGEDKNADITNWTIDAEQRAGKSD